MSSTFVLPFPTQRLNKSSQIGLEIFKGCLLPLNFVQFGYNRSWLKYRCFNLERKILKTYALSFYRSKMIFDRPNCFGRVQVVLIRSKLFWLDHNQIILVTFKLNFSALSFIIWTCLKWFGPHQNKLDSSRTIGTRPKLFGRSKIILDPWKEKALIFWTMTIYDLNEFTSRSFFF